VSGRLPAALVAVGVLLLVLPAMLPVGPALHHDTGPSTGGNESMLEEQGYRVIAYENLSERGRELYRRTLESGGQYTVPLETGAPAFPYPSAADLADIKGVEARLAAQGVVIERPRDADLPPADERVYRSNGSDSAVARYDYMTTRTANPPLTALSSLLRLFAVAGGVLAIAAGGYLRARP